MYAVGAFIPFEGAGASGPLAGIYLFGQENGGWGIAGSGSLFNNYEPVGQWEGRWFLSLPFGVGRVNEYPSVVSYNGRTYICGGYTYNLVIDEQHRLWRQGIRPPERAPEITGAAGVENLAYLTWFDELTNERSPLSIGTPIGNATPRTWINLPTRPPDDVWVGNDLVTSTVVATGRHVDVHIPLVAGAFGGNTWGRLSQVRGGDRISLPLGSLKYGMAVSTYAHRVSLTSPDPLFDDVVVTDTEVPIVVGSQVVVAPVIRPTHLELWLAMAGDLPRLAMRVAVGTTTVVESKGIGDLGEAFITQFQRFPRCSMNTIYHDRQIMAGDSENPDTVYLSALFQPERFEGLTFRTRDSKAITGLLSTRDFCMVFTRSSAFLLQGYTDTDYTMNPVDQSIGALGHNCNVVIHGNPYVWSEKGPYMFNGAWHPLSPENRWSVPVSSGKDMIATEDPFYNTYIVARAYNVATSLHEPYAAWNQSGAEILDPEIPARTKFFAILDYTPVQAETGGAMQPARLMWDTTDYWEVQTEGGIIPDLDVEVFAKYLRNRYTRGNLYRVYGLRRDTGTNPYTPLERLDGNPSFAVSGMLLPHSTIRLDLMPEDTSVIVTPFDYLGDGGGYLMEQKQIKRLWYYMRMEDGTVELFMGPGPGYWGSRIYPLTAPPVIYTTTFAGGDYRGGVVEAPHADVIMPVLPDFLSGRGMWLRIAGTRLSFLGYAVEPIWGAEIVHPL